MDIHPLPSILQKQKEPFCQTFSRTASAPPEELESEPFSEEPEPYQTGPKKR